MHYPIQPITKQQIALGVTLLAASGSAATASNGAGNQGDNQQSELRLDPISVEAVPQLSSYGRDGRYLTGTSSFALGGSEAALQKTPFSADILDRDFLDDVAAGQLDETALYAPGVQPGNQVNRISQVFVSRGFQLGRDSILINGTQQSDGFSITPDALVASVEYYRGPSSVLNGQTPPGGAINIVTKKPQREAFTELAGELDQHGKRKAALDYNSGRVGLGPADGFFRINAMGEDSDTFREDVERETRLAAPVATFELGDSTRLTLEANWIERETTGDRGLPLLGGDTDEAAERFDEKTLFLGTTAERNKREQQRVMLDLSHRFSDAWQANFQVSYGETDRSFFSVFAQDANTSTSDFDLARGRLARTHFGTRDVFESLDARLDANFELETGPLKHSGIVAVQRRDFERRDKFTGFVTGADTVSLSDPETDLAFQADDGPSGGLQSDEETWEQFLQDRITFRTGPLEGLSTVVGGRFTQFENEVSDIEADEFTGRVGLGYTPPPADWLTVYANYAESFDPQSKTTASGNPVPPQEGRQWELGAKTELLQRRLLVTAAYFDITNDNVAVADPANPGAFVTVGEQANRGFEVSAVGSITDAFQLRGQYTFNDSEITQDTEGREGNELALTPQHSASLWGRYNLLGGRLSLGGGAVYVDDRFATASNAIELTSYTRLDANVEYRVTKAARLGLKVTNIADERYFTGGETFGGSVQPGQPRTFSLEASYRF